MLLLPAGYFSLEADTAPSQTVFNQFFQTHKSPAANEEDVAGINFDVFLMGVFSPALGRHVHFSSFDDFQQGLLHTFSRNIPRNTGVFGLAADLIDLVDVNNL